MKNGMFKTSLLAGAVAFSGLAMANPSATLAVKGEVSTGTCTAVLTTTNLDLGNISADSLPTTKSYKVLSNRDAYFNVRCSSPLRIQLSITDNRSDSAIPASEIDSSGTVDGNVLGLGKTVKGENIGGYTLMLNTVYADVGGKTTYMNVLSKNDAKDENWHIEPDKSSTKISPLNNTTGLKTKSYMSFAELGKNTPYPSTGSEFRFKVNAYITSGLRTITDQQNIDGNVTFNIDYL
ncbi:DUF1120 domain-containing protein [Enterobacter sp. JS8-1]|uniref:DUF1120 domain-containing protein n=1 Tax=Enterobacter sp. JS8-1 TaxID=3411633 RepID=UPI003BA382B4